MGGCACIKLIADSHDVKGDLSDQKMHLGNKINQIRQAIIWSLTKNIGLSREKEAELIAHDDIQKILITRPNHRLGNTLLITPLVQEVIDTFPRAEIDLFVKGNVAPIVLRNYENINRIIRVPAKPFLNPFRYLAGWLTMMRCRYDLVINAAHHSSSGRLSTRFARARHKYYGDPDDRIKENQDNHQHSAKYPVNGLRLYLNRCGIRVNAGPVPSLDLKLSASELANGRKLLDAMVTDDKKTICLFTNATGSKCYSKSWWESFHQRLHVAFPDYNIIEILPANNLSQLSFAIPSFYSKQIREIGSLIANTDLFIGADSGMMHLASAVQTNTVGLFKITDPATFGPYNNSSVSINTNSGSMDDWINVIGSVLVNSGMRGEWPVSNSKQ